MNTRISNLHGDKKLRMIPELTDSDKEFDECFVESIPEKSELITQEGRLTHALNIRRPIDGEFVRVCVPLRNHPDKFSKYFRMSVSTYDYILGFIAENITKSSNGLSVTPAEQLAVTLRFLSTGISFEALSHSFLMDARMVNEIVRDVCETIYERLRGIHMPCPTPEDFVRVAGVFEKLWKFPNCVGAIDGKHIRIIKHSPKNGSILMQAIADGNYRFLYIDCGSYGNSDDGGTFASSALNKFISDPKNLPDDHFIKGMNIVLPSVFICGDAYPLRQNMMKPYYSKTSLTREENTFNTSLLRARRCVLCAFGICANTWKVLLNPIEANEETCRKIINGSAILHNVIIDREGIKQTLSKAVVEKMDSASMKTGRRYNRCSYPALVIRNYFKEYFNR